MWSTADEITAHLSSGDPARIAAGLESLDFHLETMDSLAVAPLSAKLLDPFGHEVPDRVAELFVKLLSTYDAFTPALSAEEIEREVALAAARFGPSVLGLEASLLLKSAADPVEAVRLALAAIAERGVLPDEVECAGAFVSYLLAGDASFRAATVDGLASWRGREGLSAVIDWVAAELEDDERARVLG
jgi:hypothetical protein